MPGIVAVGFVPEDDARDFHFLDQGPPAMVGEAGVVVAENPRPVELGRHLQEEGTRLLPSVQRVIGLVRAGQGELDPVIPDRAVVRDERRVHRERIVDVGVPGRTPATLVLGSLPLQHPVPGNGHPVGVGSPGLRVLAGHGGRRRSGRGPAELPVPGQAQGRCGAVHRRRRRQRTCAGSSGLLPPGRQHVVRPVLARSVFVRPVVVRHLLAPRVSPATKCFCSST